MKQTQSHITIKGETIPVTIHWLYVKDRIQIFKVEGSDGQLYDTENWNKRFKDEIKRSEK